MVTPYLNGKWYETIAKKKSEKSILKKKEKWYNLKNTVFQARLKSNWNQC